MFRFFSKPKEPVQFCFHTDIHCHIVPGVDDGSPDAVTSANLVERMQRWGIERIIASPHVTLHTFENNLSTLTPALESLKDELNRRGNGIVLSHAAENRIDELMMNNIKNKSLITLPNDYVLIENSFIQEPMTLDSVVFELQMMGLRPILAHPERYAYYHNRIKRYEELHNAGLMFQVNVLSLADAYGGQEPKVARELIKRGLVNFVGTDLHRLSHADAIDRYLTTKQAREDMAALADVVRNDSAFI